MRRRLAKGRMRGASAVGSLEEKGLGGSAVRWVGGGGELQARV